MSTVVIFPAAKQAQAQAYADAVNAHWAANYEPGGVWTYPPREDCFGQWGVCFFGEMIGEITYVEPPELLALRADGVRCVAITWLDTDV